jgi:PAS domain S-box-containing protein
VSVLVAAIRHARSGRRHEGLALGLGASLVLAGLVSDGLVDVLSLDWIYTSELGFVAMALIMNTRLARDWILAGRRVERTEEALRRSEADLQRAQSVARIGSWRLKRHSQSLEGSPELTRILGLPPGTPLTRESVVRALHPDDRGRVVAATRAVFDGQPLDVRCRLVVDGQERWAHGLGQAEHDASGDPLAIVGTIQDITDQVALENRLFQAQKMEAVGQLAGGVAHDFNNLLQVIGGHAELALMQLPGDHPAREFVATVEEAGGKATDLVRQLLAFSRQQVLRLESLDVNEVAGAFMKTLARTLGEHIRISFVPGHDLGAVRADRGQLEVVVMNLCINARDAMPEGGLLTLATENVTVGDDYVAGHPWAKPGDYVRLAVSDNGCGMDTPTLERVFEPFFTTKEVGRGTGLGLATVYGIVKQHGGMIDVSSDVDEGTEVQVYLPRVRVEGGEDSERAASQTAGGDETILIVEDEEAVRIFARQILSRAGYTVLTAADGVEAFQVAERDGDRLDLAVLDVILPGASGRAIHDTLRERFPRLRFLFVSGFSPDTTHSNFVLEQGLEFLQKPVSADTLLRTVRRILDEGDGGQRP